MLEVVNKIQTLRDLRPLQGASAIANSPGDGLDVDGVPAGENQRTARHTLSFAEAPYPLYLRRFARFWDSSEDNSRRRLTKVALTREGRWAQHER